MVNIDCKMNSAISAALPAFHDVLVSQTVLAPMGLLAMLCLWRLWKFKLCPYLYPDNPRELPYWTPCMYARWHDITLIPS